MSERSETILDQCLSRLKAGESLDEILSQHPEEATELRPLLVVAAEFEAAARQTPPLRSMARTMARAHEKAHHSTHHSSGWLSGFFAVPVLARAAVLAIIALITVGGTVTTASQAVPGDWLYPLKLWTERARFSLTMNAENRAELRIDFASERLREAVDHYQGKGVLDQELLNTMLDEARLAVQESLELPDLIHQRIVNRAASVTNYQEETLKTLKNQAPAEAERQIQPWIERCQERWRWMRGMDMNTDMEPSTDQKPRSSRRNRQSRMQQWVDDCPMW
ncbi:hypothetical protein KQH29_00470 [bacterium]|nr:hypothetical protein [bacterium]